MLRIRTPDCLPFTLALLLLLAGIGLARAASTPEPSPSAAVLFAKGETLYQASQWQAAAEAYARALAADPRGHYAARALYSRAWSLLQAGDTAGAARDFLACASQNPTNALAAECQLKAGDALRAIKRYDEALQAYDAARAAGGTWAPEALAGRAFTLDALGRASLAADTLETFARQNPNHALAAAALFRAAWLHWDGKRMPQARALFDAVAAGYPQSPQAAEAALMGARAAEAAGDAAAATAGYATAIRLGGTNEAAQLATIESLRLELAAGRHAVVLTNAATLIAAHPSHPVLRRASFYRGEALLELNRPAEALEAYRLAGTDDPAAASGAAWSLRKLGRQREAAAAFAQLAAGRSPYAADAVFWAARCQEDAGDLQAAGAGYAACTNQGPANPHATEAAYDLAWVLIKQGSPDEAMDCFDAFARSHPRHALATDASFRAGELAFERQLFAMAVTNYAAAIETGVAFKELALLKLGLAQFRLQQADAARQTFLRLAQEFPRSAYAAEASYRAGRILQEAGRFDEARTSFAAVTNGPFAVEAALGSTDCLRAGGKLDEARRAYDAIAQSEGKRATAARALLGTGHCLFEQRQWQEAAKTFLKVDVLYDDDALKPEALAMIVKCWQAAGDVAKVAIYRHELKTRYPQSKEALGQ